MKVLLDHNLSPALAKVLRALFGDEHEIVALSEKFPRNITDIDLMKERS